MRRWFVMVGVGLTLLGCDGFGGAAGRGGAAGGRDEPRPGEAEVVAVDWLGRGTVYAATVLDRRGGLTSVRYADGDREWVESSRIRPWPELSGRRLSVWSRRSALAANVIEVRGELVHVRFDDGAHTWFSRDMLYALEAPATPEGSQAGPTPSFPLRAPVDPSTVQVGRHVLAYWDSGSGPSPSQPWVAHVDSLGDGRASLTYSDGSTANLELRYIVRVFDPPGRVALGQRVVLSGSPSVAAVVDTRAGLLKIEASGAQSWVEQAQVLAVLRPVDDVQLTPGALVTALWGGTTLYHATVEARSGEQVTLAWHDGSTPSAVAVADIVELWRSSGLDAPAGASGARRPSPEGGSEGEPAE